MVVSLASRLVGLVVSYGPYVGPGRALYVVLVLIGLASV